MTVADPRSGAPVRVVVPSVRKQVGQWLQRIVLTNSFRSNDTYAEWNNDTDSHAKTFARFIHVPSSVRRTTLDHRRGSVAYPAVQGQVWLQREGQALPADDPHFSQAAWQDAHFCTTGIWGEICRTEAAARSAAVDLRPATR